MKSILPIFKISIFVGLLLNINNLYAVESDTTLSNLFEMPIEELIEQEVTIATKSAQKVRQTPSVVSVITSEEIKALGYRELEEVLQSIPGYGVTQTKIGSKPFEVRGVSDIRQGGRLLVLLDGTPYNDVMYGSSFFYGAVFNLDAVEKIEVIRGPGSALYGRNAFSGVINIITRKAKSPFQVEAGTSYGSYNTYDAHIGVGTKQENFNAILFAKYFSTDGTDQTFEYALGGERKWYLVHNNLYLNTNIGYKNFQFHGSFSSRTDGTSPGKYMMSDGNSVFNIGTYNIQYGKDLSSKLKASVKIYGRNEYRVQNVEYIKPGLHPFYPEGAYAQPTFHDYKYGGEVELNYQILKNNNILFGIQSDIHGIKDAKVKSNYDLDNTLPITYISGDDTLQYSKDNMPYYAPGWIRDNGHDYQNAALYIQDVHYFLPNLSIILGGRLDFDSEAGLIFNPRLGIVLEPTTWSSLKLLYGQAYRAPTANEQYKIMGFDQGNEDLKYEEIKTSELAYSINYNKLFSQISIYYNKLDNLVLQQEDTVTGIISYFNTGINESYGMEFESKFFIMKSIYTFVNYSYAHSIDTRKDNEQKIDHPNVAPHKFNIGVSVHALKYLNFAVSGQYRSTIVKFTDSNGSEISQDKVGDYVLLNATLRLTNLVKGLDIGICGYNLLDTTYYFQDDSFTHQPKQNGMNFLLKATYLFN